MSANRAADTRLQELLALCEQENKLIAFDLHDGLVQFIVGAKLNLESIDLESEQFDSKTRTRLRQTRQYLSEAIEESRKLMGKLRGTAVDEERFPSELSQVLEGFRSKSLEVHENIELESLPSPQLNGTIYRIVQEALQNVQKHSSADLVLVSVKGSPGEVEILVADNGIGFEPEKLDGDRMGLRGMQFRCEVFGGSFSIVSISQNAISQNAMSPNAMSPNAVPDSKSQQPVSFRDLVLEKVRQLSQPGTSESDWQSRFDETGTMVIAKIPVGNFGSSDSQ